MVLAPKPDFTSDVYNCLNIFYFVATLKGVTGFEIIASLPGFGQLTNTKIGISISSTLFHTQLTVLCYRLTWQKKKMGQNDLKAFDFLSEFSVAFFPTYVLP